MRIFALSDIHADYHDNFAWVHNLSAVEYKRDTLILAGDLSHDSDIFTEVLTCLREKFAQIFFVPGNHDLWLRSTEWGDSLAKYHAILKRCDSLDVKTRPGRVSDEHSGRAVWIVPLQAWYAKPEESPDSLFVEKIGEDLRFRMWADDRAIRWPGFGECVCAADYFLGANEQYIATVYDAPVISFSHFLSRRELMFSTMEELIAAGMPLTDPQPRFNFSRVAGCARLDDQIRRLGSVIHVYGHQHRNRNREIDNVHYISFCLGYPRERAEGRISGFRNSPCVIWDTDISGSPERGA